MNKKKVLILAYDFPPYVSVGALRPHAWLKYFPENGIYPIVVTRQWANSYKDKLDYISPGELPMPQVESTAEYTIIRSPYFPSLANKLLLRYGDTRYRLFRKAVTAYYELMQYFFLTGTKKPMCEAADNYLKNNEVDLILATGEPFVLFKYAADLGSKYKIPWVADYRDPWTQDKHRDVLPFARTINSFIERRCVRSASAICTVSYFFQTQIESLIKNIPFWIIPNGYAPEVKQIALESTQKNTEFSIALAGTISPWHPIESFLKVLSNLVSEQRMERFILHFYGINGAEKIDSLIADQFPNLRSHIIIHPRMQNEELSRNLGEHNCLLLFNNYANMGTKIYDYLALQRKIIFCYTKDPDAERLRRQFFNLDMQTATNDHLQADLIKKTNSGVLVGNALDLAEVLVNLYAEFKQNGYVRCDSVGVDEFSRQNQTKILANAILELIKHTAPSSGTAINKTNEHCYC